MQLTEKLDKYGGLKMNCMEREDFQKSELFHIIDDIKHMENEGRRYKAMFVLWDVIQRMKRNELTASMNQAEVFADYGIIIGDGRITDWGNIDIDTWKNKLILSGGLKKHEEN